MILFMIGCLLLVCSSVLLFSIDNNPTAGHEFDVLGQDDTFGIGSCGYHYGPA